MSDRRKRQNELYWQQKELRDNTMLIGNYEQIQKMREKQDDLYKRFKFFEGLNGAMERNKDNEPKSDTSEKM